MRIFQKIREAAWLGFFCCCMAVAFVAALLDMFDAMDEERADSTREFPFHIRSHGVFDGYEIPRGEAES